MLKETILVIDDEISLRDMMTGFIEKLGFNVLAAASGEEGIEIIKEEPVDLILTDYLMPNKNGLVRSKEH